LMSEALPALDRFALAVAHLPGAADVDPAGGGWYDVTATADGHLAIVVGDVGAAPTSVASQLCRVVAGLGSERRSPAVALEALDGAARGIPGSLPRGIGGAARGWRRARCPSDQELSGTAGPGFRSRAVVWTRKWAVELQKRVIADRQACVQEPASSQVKRRRPW